MTDVGAPKAAKPSAYRERNSTADRALDILGLFTPVRLSLSAIDVATELAVARSTAYRYLLTLTSAGYLEEDPTGGFRLGLKVFELARLARASYGLSQVSLPFLRQLARETDETVLLTRRSGTRAVCLEKEESVGHRVRLTYERGTALPINAGASALVLLAWEEPEVIRELLRDSELQQFTPTTVTDEDALIERLAKIRSDGYAIGRGELDPDAVGIAAPIRDDRGHVVAGLSVVSVKSRVTESRIRDLVSKVRASAGEISDLIALAAQ